LQPLIRKGLQNNCDLRITVARLLEARAQLGITRLQQFPELTASASAARVGVSRNTNPPVPRSLDRQRADFILGPDLIFEVDLWGKLRRSTEASRAQLLATQEACWTVVQSLVTEIAAGYFELLALDRALDVARRTVAGRENSLRLIQYQKERGVASAVDLRQAESLLISAQARIPDLERQIEQAENRIAILMGEQPGPVVRGTRQEGKVLPPPIPAGLVAPVFNAGCLSANLQGAEARQEQALLAYQFTVQSAFGEVADALVGYRKSREARLRREDLAATLSSYAEMSQIRYRGGVTSFLEVLDAERQLFDAELSLAGTQSQESVAFVQVYKALGGGWRTPAYGGPSGDAPGVR
jgi:multidrug efflux system outer membrane protein